jgi:hypothetical protein
MDRTPESIEFEERWKQIRTKNDLIPLKSDLTPMLFKDFLPSISLIELDIVNN